MVRSHDHDTRGSDVWTHTSGESEIPLTEQIREWRKMSESLGLGPRPVVVNDVDREPKYFWVSCHEFFTNRICRGHVFDRQVGNDRALVRESLVHSRRAFPRLLQSDLCSYWFLMTRESMITKTISRAKTTCGHDSAEIINKQQVDKL
jgi:hypothetical protein